METDKGRSATAIFHWAISHFRDSSTVNLAVSVFPLHNLKQIFFF